MTSYLDKDDISIRGLPIAAINRNDSTKTTVVPNLVPPNYYDPESRYTSEEYEKMGRFPTVIPSDGNLFVDGRIIGPSMDELWYVIKKMLGGRLSDNLTVSENVSENANIQRAVNFDLAIPYGNAANIHNDKDTSLSEVPVSEFNFDYGSENKHGDPVGYKFVKDTTEGVMNETVVVNKFINQNDAIVYPIYKSLKSLSDKVVTFDTTTAKDRDIKNFTAWKDDGVSVVKDNETVLEGMWAPREVPYSLRELEAMIMGNKFNIITEARFVKENFAVTGNLGKRQGVDYNEVAGSLYQMHKNYNFDVSNPNTVYDEKSTDPNTRVVIDDDDIRSESQKKKGMYRYVNTYGKTAKINANPELFSAQETYLSAAGDWRAVSAYNRIPCLRDEY